MSPAPGSPDRSSGERPASDPRSDLRSAAGASEPLDDATLEAAGLDSRATIAGRRGLSLGLAIGLAVVLIGTSAAVLGLGRLVMDLVRAGLELLLTLWH